MMEALLGVSLFGVLSVLFIWFLPVVLILRSDKTSGLEKLVWLGLIFFFSWFSWILYAVLAPVSAKEA